LPQNLINLRVLVTRPEPQASELSQLIENAGGVAVNFPTIEFAPPLDMDSFHDAINHLGNQEWLIFISPHAVYASVPFIRQRWPEFPPQVKFAAVGEGTAKALFEAGYNVAAVPENQWNSEGLLAMPVFQPSQISEQKVAIIRGVGGREYLDKVLAERGARVTPVIAYQRVLPQIDVTDYLSMLKQHRIDVIVCTSFEGVRNLKILFGQTGWTYLQVLPIIVMSERIKMLARDLGFQTIWVSRNASQTAILELLVTLRK
jgi:uroporphyrinogen-III synthase